MSCTVIVHNCDLDSWTNIMSKESQSNIFLNYDSENVALFAFKLMIFQQTNACLHIYYKDSNIYHFIKSLECYSFFTISLCCCNHTNCFSDIVHKVAEDVFTVPESIQNIWENDFDVILPKKKKKRNTKKNTNKIK